MLSDLRFAFRQIAKAPGFTAIIVLTLALGIGACTAMYSALDSIVLHPYDDPATERNVTLRSIKLPERTERGLSFPDFIDLEKEATSFEFMAQFSGGYVHLTGTDEPRRLRQIISTPRYFDIFGVKMTLGRAFLPEEFVSGKDNVIVLGYACWQRNFGGAPDIIGRTLQIDGRTCTVVGVISERFERAGNFTDVWLPRAADLPPAPNVRDPRGFRVNTPTIARLRPGVTLEQAQSELDIIAAALAEKYPDSNKGYGVQAYARSQFMRRLQNMIQILFGAVICLMLVACANVASLLLVRASARQREMSVRAALGATRARLIRQLLTENILVAVLGGTAGVLLAQWALDFIRSSIPSGAMSLASAPGVARLGYVQLDSGVLVFALVVSVATALIFGLAPAWLSSFANVNEALKQGTRGSTEGRARGRFRATLVIVEIGLAITLLTCSALQIRSFLRLAGHDPGFDLKSTAFVRLTLSGINYAKPEQENAFVQALIPRIQNAAGVEAAATTNHFPLSGFLGLTTGFEIEGGPTIAVAERPLAKVYYVSADYFRTLGIPLKQGRVFSERDHAKTRRVAIINQTLARQHFDHRDPIGQRIKIGSGVDGWREIVGVVGDVCHASADEVQPAQYYEPQAQKTVGGLDIIVVARGRGNPALLPAIIKAQVQTLDPDLAVGDLSTAETFLRDKYTLQRLTLHLLTAFAAIGLLIAAIGIYGVIAFSVSQRTVEIGIRMALGAQKQDVLLMVLRQGALLVGAGFAIGIAGTLVAGRAIQSQLYNTSGSDPVALVSITLFISAVAALACWLPARRATKIDPVVALRSE